MSSMNPLLVLGFVTAHNMPLIHILALHHTIPHISEQTYTIVAVGGCNLTIRKGTVSIAFVPNDPTGIKNVIEVIASPNNIFLADPFQLFKVFRCRNLPMLRNRVIFSSDLGSTHRAAVISSPLGTAKIRRINHGQIKIFVGIVFHCGEAISVVYDVHCSSPPLRVPPPVPLLVACFHSPAAFPRSFCRCIRASAARVGAGESPDTVSPLRHLKTARRHHLITAQNWELPRYRSRREQPIPLSCYSPLHRHSYCPQIIPRPLPPP